jgi:hypothetical protein
LKLFRHGGAHRAVLSAKARIAAVVSVAAIVVGGGVVAVSAANAYPWDPDVLVGGTAHCRPGDLPFAVHYTGSNGDSGKVGTAPNGVYWFQTHHVQPSGEWMTALIDCRQAKAPRHFYQNPASFTVTRPLRGNKLLRNLF